MSADEVGNQQTQPSVVDEFVAAWAAPESPPDLAEYVPDAEVIRRSALIDLIRVDLQQRWLRAGMGKRLAAYCAEFPELESTDLPASLIYEEFVIRRHGGHRVDPQDYLLEYPAQADRLRQLLNTEDVDQTALHADDDTDDADEQTALSPGAYLDDDDTALAQDPTAYAEEQTALSPQRDSSGDDETGLAVDHTAAYLDDPTRTAEFVPHDGPAKRGIVAVDPSDDLDEIAVGDQLDDFDLLTVLGSGAFARVFLARQRSMQRLVAVKISADHGTEPQTLAQLDHDYIVRVFDQRVLPHRRLKLLYMQFLPGGTLLSVLKWVRATPPAERTGELLLDAIDAAMEEKGEIRPSDSSVRAEIASLSWPETVAWLGRRLAEALDYAGAHGVLHRDVKPANVLLTSEGVPKLADFNISFSRNVAGDSPIAYFGGSLSYMSPEQLEACHPGRSTSAGDLDTRSDIFSLGVVLWELLTGRKPFGDEGATGGDATTLDAMLNRRRDGIAPEAYADLPPDCPAALRRVLTECLAPDKAQRWSTGTALAQQFDLCLDARARDLVDPPPGSWRLRLRRWTVPLIVLAIAIPNGLASIYNIHHNKTLIIDRLNPEVQQRFELIVTIVNVIFFPLAAFLMIYMCRYVITVPRGLRRGKVFDSETLARARSDALLMGDRVVYIAFGLWMAAGVAFPLTLQIVTGDIPTEAFVHFIASLAVCGAIAVAYPFFLVNFFIVRSTYPTFMPHGQTNEEDARQLHSLDRRSNLYLAVAASIPLLGVAGVTFLQPSDIPLVIVAVRVLCVGGILAFVLAYWLFRLLEDDLKALQRVVASHPDSR